MVIKLLICMTNQRLRIYSFFCNISLEFVFIYQALNLECSFRECCFFNYKNHNKIQKHHTFSHTKKTTIVWLRCVSLRSVKSFLFFDICALYTHFYDTLKSTIVFDIKMIRKVAFYRIGLRLGYYEVNIVQSMKSFSTLKKSNVNG